jgi:hypothetical protein
MPDTGAPWNIPYVEPADLVRDYPAADEAQALAIAAGLTSAQTVLQVLSTIKAEVFTESVGSGAISGDVTGLTVTVTPASATSRLLVSGVVGIASSSSGDAVSILLYRDGAVSDYRGDAGNNRTRGIGGFVPSGRTPFLASFSFLDTAGSTSATTYSIRLLNSVGTTQTVYVNRGLDDSDASRNVRGASTITVMEIA